MDELTLLKEKVEKLELALQDLTSEYYLNNFAAQQDFNKKVAFNTRLKVPHYATLPTTAETGEVAENGGDLYIASTTNTWTLVGSQT